MNLFGDLKEKRPIHVMFAVLLNSQITEKGFYLMQSEGLQLFSKFEAKFFEMSIIAYSRLS